MSYGSSASGPQLTGVDMMHVVLLYTECGGYYSEDRVRELNADLIV
jgi:hypothetical protein